MSYELDIREELIIHNENEKTRAAAARLADYIRQFDRMDGLSGMQIYSMELEADGRIAYTDDEVSTKECGYIFTDSAEGDPLVKLIEEDYSHWDDEEDVSQIVCGLEDAKTIVLRMDCSLQVASETSYGAAFWQDFLQNMEPADFGEYVRYRNAEFYTAAEPVCCWSYEHGEGKKQSFGFIVGDDDKNAGDKQNSWSSFCFQLKFENIPETEMENFGAVFDDFSAKYDLETTWKILRNAEISMDSAFEANEEMSLLAGEQETFTVDLQQLADFTAGCGGNMALRGEFFSDRGEFCFMSLGLEEGKVTAKYCTF